MRLVNFFFISSVFVTVRSDGEKVIKIGQGKLKGLKTATKFRNWPYFSFKGIPYAVPPVGDRKFDIARPAEPWKDIYDATFHRSVCPQINMEKGDVEGDEDCLYLNVYTPLIQPKNKCLAVMVFFQGGLFMLGSGNDEYYGPDYLVEKNIVLVTMNHRLGPLGFINTEDESAPGNMGLKDQVLALHWVQDNIEFFGGCPDKVTIFGQSSGATSVHMHMMSPISRGLFRAAIIQSSTALTWWALSRQPRKDAFMLGRALGIQTNDSKELMENLKKKSTEDIITAVFGLYIEDEDEIVSRDDIFPFGPSLEKGSGQEMFLSEDPWQTLKYGQLYDIPVMIGVTSEEAAIFNREYMSEEIASYVFQFLCHVLNITDSVVIEDIEESIEQFYHIDMLGDDEYGQDVHGYLEVISDMTLNIETAIAAKIMAYRNRNPVYEYLFNYKAEFGFFKEFFGVGRCAAHGDDLTYLFYSNKFRHKQNKDKMFDRMVDMMTELWTDFAKFLHPAPNKYPFFPNMGSMNMDWYLDIDMWAEMKRDLFSKNLKFWMPIYRDLVGDYEKIFD